MAEEFTVGEIAEQLKEPPARIAYMISKHRLKPVRRVGIIRLFTQGQVEAIRRELHDIQVRRD